MHAEPADWHLEQAGTKRSHFSVSEEFSIHRQIRTYFDFPSSASCARKNGSQTLRFGGGHLQSLKLSAIWSFGGRSSGLELENGLVIFFDT